MVSAFRHSDCVPVDVPANDKYYGHNDRIKCLQYFRSQTSFPTDCKLDAAQQANKVSHYIDLSTLYGSDVVDAATRRSFTDGKLLDDCCSSGNICLLPLFLLNRHSYYFDLGEGNLSGSYSSMAVIKLLFQRFHNRIAEQFATSTDWTDERIYLEARRVTVAIFQHIIYTEWIPLFLGKWQIYINIFF